MLRVVAERKGIVVPSLLADSRTADSEPEGDVLADAADSVERARREVAPVGVEVVDA
jgi:hypothetical protein